MTASERIARALVHRVLRIELDGAGVWHLTVRSFRRVVYRDEGESIGSLIAGVATWCDAGCPAPKRVVES